MGEIFSSLDVTAVLTYSIALAIILGSRLVSPIISRIVIFFINYLK